MTHCRQEYKRMRGQFDEIDTVPFDKATLAPLCGETEPMERTTKKDAVDAAAVLELHARAELAAGRACHARALFQESIAIRLEEQGEAHPALPSSLCALGVLALRTRLLDEARRSFERAYILVRRHGTAATPDMAVICNNLGVVARLCGDYEVARDHHEAALVVKVEVYGWVHHSVALTLVNLGRVCESMGELRVAGEHYSRARLLAERTEGQLGPVLAAALLGLGRFHQLRGDDLAASVAFERALKVREGGECSPLDHLSVRSG